MLPPPERRRRARGAPAVLVAVAGLIAIVSPVRAEGDAPKATEEASPSVAPPSVAPPSVAPPATVPPGVRVKGKRCREQRAQDFLVRGNWFKGDARKQNEMLAAAIRYRTEKYGYFEGYGNAAWNKNTPRSQAESTTFMGMPVQVNKRIIPALECVEAALKANGAAAQYAPRSIGGIRFKNTYRGSEVSNHVYGIAIDIEPDRNTCCGCVPPWNEHPLCKKKGTPYDRMAMPRSWVETFERYGFYWLGHDVLQDTMHYEFLGDPDTILE